MKSRSGEKIKLRKEKVFIVIVQMEKYLWLMKI